MMHLKISPTFGFQGGSEAINLPQHRKEGWTRHIHAGPSRIICHEPALDTLNSLFGKSRNDFNK
jgi:hypothetical protein